MMIIAFVGNIVTEVVKLIAFRSMFSKLAKYHRTELIQNYNKKTGYLVFIKEEVRKSVEAGPNSDIGNFAWAIIIGTALNYYYLTFTRRFSK